MIETDGLVAELRDVLRDLLAYVDDPSWHPIFGAQTLENRVPLSHIDTLEAELTKLRKKAEVIARAKRLSK